jgi:membrane-associated protease RseP (regulator of RpoE activity)
MTYQPATPYPAKRKRKLSGMTWIIIIIAALFVMGGALSALRKAGRNVPRIAMNLNRSNPGVNDFDAVAGGVTFDNVEPPGGPADKAGLVGGDIIQTFDGKRVTDEDEIRDLLRQTPIGKTVEITYLRDGELKKTQLTTIPEAEFNDLQRVYRSQPKGYFGFESNRHDQDCRSANKDVRRAAGLCGTQWAVGFVWIEGRRHHHRLG